jgi:hypothetical protein
VQTASAGPRIGFQCADCGAKPELMPTQRGANARLKWRVSADAATAESRKRPAPRPRGFRAALECMDAEDKILGLLCGPGVSISASQVDAALELARDCICASHSAAFWGRVTTPVYHVHLDDFD